MDEVVWRSPPKKQQSDAEREAICAWLRRHGINPREVTPLLAVTRGTYPHGGERDLLHAALYLRNEAGTRYMDRTTGQAVTLPIVVALNEPPPVASGPLDQL
jgi:hypothetical protein